AQGMAYAQNLGAMGQFAGEAVVDAALDDDAAAGGAALAGGIKSALNGAIERYFEVGIVEYDQRVLAAQFELHLFLPGGRLFKHLAAGGQRAGEGNGFDARVFDEGGAYHRAASHDQAEHAGGQAAAADDLGQRPGRTRDQVGRLEHHAVAVGQGGRDLPGGNGDWKVPGRDDAHHAERLARHLDLYARAHRSQRIAFDAQRFTGEELEYLARAGHLADAFGQRLAFFARQQFAQFVLARQQFGADHVQSVEALLRRAERPGGPGGLGRLERHVDVGGAGAHIFAHHVGEVGRIDVLLNVVASGPLSGYPVLVHY